MKTKKQTEIELVPDAWPRFERFIKEIVKAGPQHRKDKPGKRVAQKGSAAQSRKLKKEPR